MIEMNDNLNTQNPVEFFSAERIKIEIDGQQILWRDMKLEIDSRIGEHTIGKIKYIGSVNQLSLYDALIDRKGDKEIKILGRSNIADNTGNSTEKIFLNGVIKELQINETASGALTVEITAISKSVLLDRIPRYRSFQDPTLTYSAIAEEINGNYGTNDGKIVNVGEDMQIVPRMTIQYNETDWEYLKRIASYTGQPVMAYSDKVFVGFFKSYLDEMEKHTNTMNKCNNTRNHVPRTHKKRNSKHLIYQRRSRIKSRRKSFRKRKFLTNLQSKNFGFRRRTAAMKQKNNRSYLWELNRSITIF
ncbi:MAG: hypothetical protein ACFN4U_01640 [Candidatus Absconditicoccaceae bacterium]